MELEQIYREAILDHARNPRNHGAPERIDLQAEAYNALCGDRLELMLTLDDATITHLGIRARACAICTAAASLTGEALPGLSLTEAGDAGTEVRRAISGERDDLPQSVEGLSPMLAIKGQRPRHKCVTLIWDAVDACIAQHQDQN